MRMRRRTPLPGLWTSHRLLQGRAVAGRHGAVAQVLAQAAFTAGNIAPPAPPDVVMAAYRSARVRATLLETQVEHSPSTVWRVPVAGLRAALVALVATVLLGTGVAFAASRHALPEPIQSVTQKVLGFLGLHGPPSGTPDPGHTPVGGERADVSTSSGFELAPKDASSPRPGSAATGITVVSAPSSHPTGAPSSHPAGAPSSHPTGAPSSHPTGSPSSHPKGSPSSHPTGSPSSHPVSITTSLPAASPSPPTGH